MGKNSSIEGTHLTFNPWWGCIKVSPGCKHCYAETSSRRVGLSVWGARSDRRFFSDAHRPRRPRRSSLLHCEFDNQVQACADELLGAAYDPGIEVWDGQVYSADKSWISLAGSYRCHVISLAKHRTKAAQTATIPAP